MNIGRLAEGTSTDLLFTKVVGDFLATISEKLFLP